MSEAKVWVDTPFKLIPSSKSGAELGKEPKGAQKLACEMTLVHNAILRGLNAVYNQARSVSTKGTRKDKLDFANFAYAWTMVLKEHHRVEEDRVFPLINELTGVPGLMDGNVAEHQEFHDGFEAYLEYADKAREHLEHDIDTLLALDKYSDKVDWVVWFKKVIDEIMGYAMKNAEFRTDEFPMTIILHDETFDEGMWQNFPPIPWLFALLLRWMFMYRRKDWWRFSGCDFASQPQQLPFA
ncbi:hypothetical protein EDB81DRAFT_865662 [Dactylonectria macrodidyma]|uniref:Hemerythrin-like domain-containing protein n=1 Tax=Dactylonectria macrodidyma TaxID=307937 RepID=A0A9P9JJN0_9HYPO|nr:hypothetical protein EDB81DRAFT_865662 [Dactylonectria macrodidyma]